MKLVFHPETDMSQAMGEVVGYVNRSRAFMPTGAVPPFIMRFDAGSVPVAQLVFSSSTRSVPEIDRKSTRLNSSHRCISYAVFCLKKKKINYIHRDCSDYVRKHSIIRQAT